MNYIKVMHLREVREESIISSILGKDILYTYLEFQNLITGKKIEAPLLRDGV
jgi:hypothetical protein